MICEVFHTFMVFIFSLPRSLSPLMAELGPHARKNLRDTLLRPSLFPLYSEYVPPPCIVNTTEADDITEVAHIGSVEKRATLLELEVGLVCFLEQS